MFGAMVLFSSAWCRHVAAFGGWFFKYVVPAWLQGLVSVRLRYPPSVSDCVFVTEWLDTAHTFVALCHP
jgi:hypothetical protein